MKRRKTKANPRHPRLRTGHPEVVPARAMAKDAPKLESQGVDRILRFAVVANLVLAALIVLATLDALAPGTAASTATTTTSGPASIQTPDMPGASPVPAAQSFPPSGIEDPEFVKKVPLEAIYWGLFRLQESPVTALSEAQGAQLRTTLQTATSERWPEAREREAVLGALNQNQVATLAMWVSRARKLGAAASQSIYAARADALELVSKPLVAGSGENLDAHPRLAVPYYELLWGVAEVHKRSGMPLPPKVTAEIGDIVERLLGIFARMQTVYTSAVIVANDCLRPEQLAYIKKHHVPIESYSLKFRDVVPMDADVVGYVALRVMARRAGVAIKDVPPPTILDVKVNPSPSSDAKPDPEYYFAGALLLAEDPRLALDAEQSRKLMPYVKAVADANYESHMVKERIGNLMTKKQRVWIMDQLAKTAGKPRTYPSPGEVIQLMRRSGHVGTRS